MALNKTQLEAVNQSNFPNNTQQLITPELLREFNTDVITSLQLQDTAATTGSNTFVGNQIVSGNVDITGTLTAYKINTIIESSSIIYSSGSNQLGDELTDTQILSGSVFIVGSGSVNGNRILTTADTASLIFNSSSVVSTASFNAYTQSTNLRLNSLESTSQSLNQFTASQIVSNSYFATTGSNTFTGNQTIAKEYHLNTNGIYWNDNSVGYNNLEIINSSYGNVDISAINGRVRVVNSPLTLTGSALTSSNDISTSANIYGANLLTSAITASSLITASVSQSTITFTKGDGSTFNITIADVSGSSGNFVTTASFNAYTQSTDNRLNSIEAFTASVSTSVGLLQTFSSSQYKTDSSSFDSRINSITAINSASFATTGSNNFVGNQNINGTLNVTGSIIATTTSSFLNRLVLTQASNTIRFGNTTTTTYLDNGNSATAGLLRIYTNDNLSAGTLQFGFSNPVQIGNNGAGIFSIPSTTISGALTASGDISSSTLNGIGNVTLFSASVDSRINGIVVGANFVTTASFNAYTASQDFLNTTFATTSSVNSLSASIYSTDSTQSNLINGKLDTSSFTTFSTSVDSRLDLLELSGSGFATTASVNALSASIYQTDSTQSNAITNNSSSFATSISASNFNITNNSASVAVTINNLSSSIYQTDATQSNNISELSASNAFNHSRFATTGSNTFIGNQTINGDISASGNISASSLYATNATIINLTTIYETSSVIYSSGSNQLGDELSDIQILSGSVKVVGGLTVNGVSVSTQSVDISSLNAFTASQIVSNSYFATTSSVNDLSSSIYQTDSTQSNNISSNSSSIGLLQTFSGSQYKNDSSSFDSRINSAGGNVSVQEEGSILGNATSFNFIGAGVTATLSSGTASVTIPGGGSIYTGSFAITGSNTFVGDQTISNKKIIFDTTGSIATNGIQFVNSSIFQNNFLNFVANDIGVDFSVNGTTSGTNINFRNTSTDGGVQFTTNNGSIRLLATGQQVELSGSQINLNGVNFIPFSSSVDSRILAATINTSAFATTGSNAFVGNQTITGSVTISGSSTTDLTVVGQIFVSSSATGASTAPKITVSGSGGTTTIRGNSIQTRDTTNNGGIFPSTIFTGDLATSDEIGFTVDTSVFGITGWSTGPAIYVNNDIDDTYPAVFGFQNKANYTDGKITALTPFFVSQSLSVSGSATFSELTGSLGAFSASVSSRINAGGGTIDTGSFATTGSNTFVATQTLSGSKIVFNQTGSNNNGLAWNVGGSIYSDQNKLNFLAQDAGLAFLANGTTTQTVEFRNITPTGSIEFASNTGQIFIRAAGNSIEITGSTGTFIQGVNFTTFSSSVDSRLLGITNAGYATTGSNYFTGQQTLTDVDRLNQITLDDHSGSLVLYGKGFTSSSLANITASSAGVGNIIFKNNNNSTTTIVSGSNNIFSNPAGATAGFNRYIGGSNNIINTTSGVQISQSMAFSPTFTQNYIAGNVTMRGPVSASSWTFTSNNIAGTLNLGSSAAAGADKIVGTLTMATNTIPGTLTIIANGTSLTSTTNLTSNYIAASTTLNLTSSAVSMLNNVINDGGFTLSNQCYSSSLGLGQLAFNRNNIGGQANTFRTDGAVPVGATNMPSLSDNLIGGGNNIMFSDVANSPISDGLAFHNIIRNIVFGHNLTITGSSHLNYTDTYGSAFFGRYNDLTGNKDLTAQTIFAVGTGTSTTRKTGFLIDSGSNTFVEGTLNVSGSTSFTGSVSVASTFQLQLPSGSNQQTGLATLDGGNPGAVTVSNTNVTANSIIMLTKQTLTNAHMVAVSSKGSGTFTITSNGNGDADTVAFMIINPS